MPNNEMPQVQIRLYVEQEDGEEIFVSSENYEHEESGGDYGYAWHIWNIDDGDGDVVEDYLLDD